MSGIRKRTWETKAGKQTCYEITYYMNGKLYRKAGFPTKQAAQDALPTVTKTFSKNIIVQELINIYINEVCALRCKATTIDLYKSYIKSYAPILRMQARKVQITDINKLILSWKMAEVANKTIKDRLVLLKSAYNYGIENHWLADNPVKNVDKIPKATNKLQFLTESEMKEFLQVIKKFPIAKETALIIALYTGVRISELLALHWEDVDFKNKTLHINKQVYKRKLSTPKTQHSNRKIILHDIVINKLIEYRNSLTVLHPQIFRGENGYWDRGKFIDTYFKKAVKAIGKPEYSFHSLRHTYASYLIANDIPAKFVQEQLGHSDVMTTMKIYGHIMPSIREKAIQIFDKINQCEQNMSINKPLRVKTQSGLEKNMVGDTRLELAG